MMPERLVERDAVAWRIREIDSTLTPGAPVPVSLMCESTMLVRRIWQFPGDWHALSDHELLKLFDIR